MSISYHFCSPPLVPNPALQEIIKRRKVRAYIYLKDYCCVSCASENLEKKKGSGVRHIHPSLQSMVEKKAKKVKRG